MAFCVCSESRKSRVVFHGVHDLDLTATHFQPRLHAHRPLRPFPLVCIRRVAIPQQVSDPCACALTDYGLSPRPILTPNTQLEHPGPPSQIAHALASWISWNQERQKILSSVMGFSCLPACIHYSVTSALNLPPLFAFKYPLL